jgi:hypothetical protein
MVNGSLSDGDRVDIMCSATAQNGENIAPGKYVIQSRQEFTKMGVVVFR